MAVVRCLGVHSAMLSEDALLNPKSLREAGIQVRGPHSIDRDVWTDLVDNVEVLLERIGGYVTEVLPEDIHEGLHESERIEWVD